MTYHDSMDALGKPRRRARRVLATFSLTLIPFLLAGCGGIPGGGGAQKGNTGNDQQQGNTTKTTFADDSTMGLIKKRGRLIVGVRWDAPPFAFQDPSLGTPAGFDVDMIKSIASTIFDSPSIENKITWVPLDPRENELALEQNKVDMVVGRYAISVPRKQFVDFAGPYFADPQSILVNDSLRRSSDAVQIDAVGDLNGKKVCVVTGSTDINALKSLAPTVDTSDQRTTLAQCGADLTSNAVQAIVASHVDEDALLNNSSNFAQLDADFAPASYGIGVKKGTKDLRAFLNDQISDTDSFDWDSAYRKNMKEQNTLEQPPVDRY